MEETAVEHQMVSYSSFSIWKMWCEGWSLRIAVEVCRQRVVHNGACFYVLNKVDKCRI